MIGVERPLLLSIVLQDRRDLQLSPSLRMEEETDTFSIYLIHEDVTQEFPDIPDVPSSLGLSSNADESSDHPSKHF